MTEILDVLLSLSEQAGYAGVFILMTIESSFVPFPSEVAIVPAAYLAQQGQLNLFLVILAGVAGSLIGALINYFLALTLGRSVVYAWAKHKSARILLLNEKKLERAEEYFLQYGKISTFIGRLIPGIRQLISVPAGFSRMNIKHFVFYTFLGAGLWTVILAVLGYVLGANQELLHTFYREISFFLGFTGIAVLAIIFLKKRKKRLGRFF